MTAFEHTTLAQRVVFGTGQARSNFRAEVERTDARRVMVIAAPSESDLAQTITAETKVVLHWDDVLPHVPIDKAEAARAAAKIHDVDLVVCIGGGSTTGLAKAVALTTGLPIVAIPTTYAGSEATNVWGLTEHARKTTGIDDRVLPRTIIYDAELTATLPSSLSVASGLNALAHCIDSMWAPRTDPIDQAFAAEGIRALGQGLPAIKDAAGLTLDGREETLYGAYLSAVAFSSAGSGMHHKICHVLGGAYNLPHAQTHAVVLPYVLAYLAPAAPAAEKRIAGALGSATAVDGLNDLRRRLDAPTALADHGFAEESIEEAVELILPSIPASTPRAVTPSDLRTLLRAAWSGEYPSTGLFS
ncbi:maleylacetate reductase [Rhodococcus sp. WS1]|uniref:maleylacetate reductase n=1 Tax=unclassified Rhodococcus (in: high G+C Gram-positive bacteria) TaxID=192944 RepID=UPI0011447295|nr:MULTISPECIES: maleylacetate reductase [unclassified Rhodococcus (in: high G+C Gram-positive bacteria)]ROZ52907.1 maleylacetate reductase [Rhodococcus sp. WS1]TQC35998.1 maleylacetate reductase [Rhodococcus sp. WS7]